MHDDPTALLLGAFAVAAVLVWVAGIRLSDATDALATYLGMGEDLAGMVFLAVTTNLAEVAIVVSAVATSRYDIAIGNILGGIAVQTVVLVVLDAVSDRDLSLSRTGASLALVVEGALVVAVLAAAVAGMLLSPSLAYARLTPDGIAIVGLWVGGLALVSRARRGLPWQGGGVPDDRDAEELGRWRKQRANGLRLSSPRAAWAWLLGAGVVTLVAGWTLQVTSQSLADRFHISGAVFGATVLSAVTALPEVSTGIESVRIGDFRLAFSDIFGGNAFLPVLFPLGTLLAGRPMLAAAGPSDIYLAMLGILLTSVYIAGIVFRPQRDYWRLGPDSWTVLVLYAVGIAGLAFVR